MANLSLVAAGERIRAQSLDELTKKLLARFMPAFKQAYVPLYSAESMVAMFHYGFKLGRATRWRTRKSLSKKQASTRPTKRTTATTAGKSSKSRKKPTKRARTRST